jgi:bifunctional DNA-binding transcriptional regulator/antitoxin component of YhaV-PrlF toxin-antitoxin module
MHIATISSQRQLTLSRQLLEELGLSIKDKVYIEPYKEGLLVKPLDSSVVEEVAGSLVSKVDPAKKGVPFAEAKKQAMKKVVTELANE